jgi:hypothetical protein
MYLMMQAFWEEYLGWLFLLEVRPHHRKSSLIEAHTLMLPLFIPPAIAGRIVSAFSVFLLSPFSAHPELEFLNNVWGLGTE